MTQTFPRAPGIETYRGREEVPDREVVFTIPKRLRICFRYLPFVRFRKGGFELSD